MATYYNDNSNNDNNNNQEIQGVSGDGLQTLILMNPTTPYNHHNLGSYNSSDTSQQHHRHYNSENSNNLVFLNTVGNSLTPHAPNPIQHQHEQHQLVGIPLDEISALHHPLMSLVHYGIHGDTREPTCSQQGSLSLTLSGSNSSNKVNFGTNGVRNNVLFRSRYMKAAQELLDEVVSVGREVVMKDKAVRESTEVDGGGEMSVSCRGGEISAADRQEIQMRKAKLVAMLDEVEQRYRQYHHQMQIVISWFERATGIGSAKAYTALALQTISKQSRCLKDAILSQIRASSKSLGEEDSFGGGKNEGSRLKFVDHQVRQQRALQQLGMIQPNAWRPQRGLPERSVSVLRAWLFEHFLHPYPKDSDKIMLAKQTGLTRSQVSNWFINARVRLWKPMVEEMYMEETKDHEQNGSEDKTTKSENNLNVDSVSKNSTPRDQTPATENQNMNFKTILNIPANQICSPVISTSPSPSRINIRNQSHFTLIGSPDMESISQASPKKLRNADLLQSPNSYLSNEETSMRFGDEGQSRESFTLMGGPANFIGGFGAYPIGDIGRFSAEQYPATYSGNGVSLTLGLPHGENLSLSGTHQSYLHNQSIQMGRRLEINEPDEFGTINTSTPSHSSAAYENINIQNRKRFAAQLLPDFVT